MKKGKLFTVVKFLFPLLLLTFALLEMKKFIGNLDLGLLQTEISQLHIGTLLLIFIVLFAAVLPMLLYDLMLIKVLGLKARRKEVIEQALIVNTYSNLFGFGGLIGVMLRTYFYHKWEEDKRRLVGGIAAVSLFYMTGMSLLALIVAIGYMNHPIFVQTKWLYFAVLAVSIYLPIFSGIHVIKSRRDKQSLITIGAGVKLFFISVVEWTAVFCGLWFLSWSMNIPLTFEQLFPVYVVATCAGIISMIPGGLGSFDLVFIWGMQYLHVPEEKVLVVLLFYRIGYYLLPFLLSTVLFIKRYWEKWNKSWSNIPNTIVQNVSHVAVTVLVFLSGSILLLSASVPGIIDRLRIAQEILSFPIINISHQLSVAAGFLLLGLSRGIEYSVKRTYDLTMLVLILAALFSIFKGIDYEEAIFLISVALLLRMSKGQFYRESYVLTWGKTTVDILIITVIISMYIVIGYSNLPSAKITIPSQFLPYVIEDSSDLFTSAIIGLLIALLILYAGYIISKPKKWKFENSIDHKKEILSHLNTYHGKVLSHLIFLHDKYIFWNSKKNVLISFQQYADKLVILGDPIGEKSELSHAIEEFQEISDRYGYTPVFYQVSDDMLPYLHGNGYTLFKLGGEVSKYAFVSEKIAAQIYLHGNEVYPFQDLREFKEKYTNNWESKYLGYRRKSKFSLPLTMTQITLLISKRRI
ncbi:phosphatidylglycerol lysyltransferase domain-containing protein [Neobacillus sp. CF12]|uniref:phosphatidylglycerol lysyltransferase domain-containing protein n=1 Tax=Neobacillus sp. CF12 TaxID=3055864 RepID=UPI0025A2F3D2|nr:phosphatidylglycerol lysyltransferase domain-containing protein [Neobacillus sp. CF12]MDM5331431.1 phosphatidylglycerol lysyltransferase domain-containing protein [Neobacillus sp. CF12]